MLFASIDYALIQKHRVVQGVFFLLRLRRSKHDSSRPNYAFCRLPWPVVRNGHISELSYIGIPKILAASAAIAV